MGIRKLTQNAFGFIGQNLPTILTVTAGCGVVVTAFLSGKGALEADKKLKAYEEENDVKLETRMERLKVTYPYYIPAAAAGLCTLGCMIGANRITAQQLAAAATLAKTLDTVIKDNRDGVKEVFGEKGLRKLDEHINAEHAAEYIKEEKRIYETGHGTTLCCEGFLTGILFHASPEWIHKCINDFNADLLAGNALCYNDFILRLVPFIDESLLPDVGWKFGYDLSIRNHLLEIVEDSGLRDDTHEPYLIINLREMPLLNPGEYY